MLHILNEIARDNQIRMENLAESKSARSGSTIKGHWRNYGTHRVWIEEHERMAHQIVRTTKTK